MRGGAAWLLLCALTAACGGCFKKNSSEAGPAKAGPAAAKPSAKSGVFYRNFRVHPKTLHPITDVFTQDLIGGYVFESLASRNIDTNEWEPGLAEKWEVSSDGQTLAFSLYKGLKWSDGRPLEALDAQFSFEAYKDPKYGYLQPGRLQNIESAKAIDGRRIVFRAREPHFANFRLIAELPIIPRHIYQKTPSQTSGPGAEGQPPAGSKAPAAEPPLKEAKIAGGGGEFESGRRAIIGSGPYKVTKWIRGKLLMLAQNPYWKWRSGLPHNHGKWLFEHVAFRFFSSETDILLRLQNGELSFSHIRPESFAQRANSPPWGVSVKKVRAENKGHSTTSCVGFNFQKPIFQDRRVRLALAHLLNRELIIKKFWSGNARRAAGPWHSWSDFADPSVKPVDFDPETAKALLSSAGWTDRDGDGILEKPIDGKTRRLEFSLIYAAKIIEKYFTVYQDDLKKAGVKMRLKFVEPASFFKLMDSGDFDAVFLGIPGHDDIDPREWHSKSARKGGSNYIRYSSPAADRLIEKGARQLNRAERIKTFRKLYRLIAEDAPAAFFLNYPYRFYGADAKIKRPKPSFHYEIGYEYWSF